MKPKSSLQFLVSVAVLFLNTASAKGELDDPQASAALGILAAKSELEHNHRFCRARAGDYGYKYDYIRYLWELKNRPYIQLSEKIFDGLPASSSSDMKQRWKRSSDELLSARSRANDNENGRYCSQYFSQMITESTPNVSDSRATLAARLGSAEEVRIIERNTGLEVGCVKAGYNGDVKQFEGMRKACECQTTLIVRTLSDREVDDYLALVAENKPQDALAFLGERIAVPELRSCYSEVQLQ